MREQRIDILSERVLSKASAICFTSNGVLKGTNYQPQLVMGAGVAKAFRDKFFLLDFFAGEAVQKNGNICQIVDTKITIKDQPLNSHLYKIVAFPTKHHFKDPSDIELIKKSARELMELIEQNGWTCVALPRPGVGFGGLDYEKDVKPALQQICDNRVVVVWK